MVAMRTRQAGAWVDSDVEARARIAGAWVEYGPEDAGLSLFTSQTPASPDSSDGSVLHLSSYILFGVAGSITAIRWYCPATLPSGAVKVAIFNPTTSTKLTPSTDEQFSSLVAGTWNTKTLTTPIVVPSGQTRIVAIRTPDRYVSSSGASSPFPLTNGPLSVDTGGGRYSTSDPDGSVQLPNSVFSNGCYFVDVVFVPS